MIRRRFVLAAAGAAIVSRDARAGAGLRLAWPRGAVVDAAVPIARHLGLFSQAAIDVTLVEAAPDGTDLAGRLRAGTADAAVGPVLMLLDPLRRGLDAKLTTGISGGGMRLLAERRSGLRHIEDVKHKRIGVAYPDGPSRLFFSIMMRRKGIDPFKDVDWIVVDAADQEAAIRGRRVDAVAASDPQAFYLVRALRAVEIATNLSGSYHQRVANVLACGGPLLRERGSEAEALTAMLRQAGAWARRNLHETASLIAEWAPRLDGADRFAMLGSETLGEQPGGAALIDDVADYADELRLLGIFPWQLKAGAFARGVCEDVMAGQK